MADYPLTAGGDQKRVQARRHSFRRGAAGSRHQSLFIERPACRSRLSGRASVQGRRRRVGLQRALRCRSQIVLMMQYTGFLDSINAIRGVAVEGHFPVCMVVGLLGKEPDVAPSSSKKYGVKIIEPILDVMGIEQVLIERDSDAAKIAPAIEKSFTNSSPSAILIGREPR